MDRPPEPAHNRYDNRGPPQNDYGRLDRPGDIGRHREASPGRRGRLPDGRTPERIPPTAEHREWSGRERDYEDRTMRAPMRDTRAPPVRPPPTWDTRDPRDPRDQRERSDPRMHPSASAIEPRRMTSSSSLANEYRREAPPGNSPYSAEQNERPQRLPQAPIPAKEEPTVNPARAALINQAEHGRHEPPRPDRDNRRERDTRLNSPRHGDDRRGDDRRMEERLPSYHGRGDVPREHRDDRSLPLPPSNRDRRDEFNSGAPTGPRGGRNDPTTSSRASRDMFQPNSGPRSSGHQAQDPNYGRLNQPSEPGPPLGPRSDRPSSQPQTPTATAPSGPAASLPAGVHPSRLVNIEGRPSNGPPLQTNVPNAPSGPRGSNRAQGSIPSSPNGWGPPTGPAAGDRGPRNTGNPLRAINNVLTGNTPADRSGDRNVPSSNPPVRGRGAARANGPLDGSSEMTSPMPPPHVSTPHRMESQYVRSSRNDDSQGRVEGFPQEEGRLENRSHKDSRRSEKSGRERSADRPDRRPDERSSRSGPSERVEGERGAERERGGREKRSGDRESSRRDREREGESRSGREPRESGRRERGSRDEGRTSGRDERDRRSRGGGGGSVGDDGRKRVRDPQDQAHGDAKRRR